MTRGHHDPRPAQQHSRTRNSTIAPSTRGTSTVHPGTLALIFSLDSDRRGTGQSDGHGRSGV
jgi:hypothetical protein